MARVKGPLFSLSASGSVAKTITFASWKGRDYAREHFIPTNPQTAGQVNVRTALTILVAKWQALALVEKDKWDVYGKTLQYSGFNALMSKGMNAYMDQLGSSTTPVSVSYIDDPPGETWTWV